MKLQQGQVWKRDEEYIRIVRVERMEVEYKSLLNLVSRDGTHHTTSKKEFCRLVKNASLLAPEQLQQSAPAPAPAPEPTKTE